jgi:hypothetical protein
LTMTEAELQKVITWFSKSISKTSNLFFSEFRCSSVMG